MSKIRFGLVGAGRVTSRHMEALGGVNGAEIVAICDPNPQALEAATKRLGVPGFSRAADMYAAVPMEVADICTPSGDHFERSMEALLHGKHVVVEKPMALRSAQAKEMTEQAARQGLKLWVAFQNRYNPAMVKVKEVIDSGRLGRLVASTVRLRWCRRQDYYSQDNWHGTWRMDGGVLSQQAIHYLDALQWLAGEIDEVHSFSARRLVEMECEDLAVATVKFANGSLGTIEAMTAARPRDIEGSVSLLGENGVIVLGGIAMNKIEVFEFEKPTADDGEVPERYAQVVPNGYGFGHDVLFKEVVQSIVEGKPEAISGSEGARSLRLLHSLYASQELSRAVRLEEHLESSRLGL